MPKMNQVLIGQSYLECSHIIQLSYICDLRTRIKDTNEYNDRQKIFVASES